MYRLMGVPLLLLVLAACGGGADEQTLRVLAASSLSETFDQLADRFEAEHDGVQVELVYDSSATLATQVTEGAPADVVATADLETMQRVLDAGAAADSVSFAGNTMVLVTPAGADGPSSFADFAAGQLDFVVCVDTAPCGKVAATLLETNGVTRAPRSYEDNVKAVLERVAADEVDAGIVYRTDVTEGVSAVEIPGAAEEVTAYGIAVVEQSEDPDLAHEFVELVLGDAGQQILREAGFVEAP